MKKIVDLTYDIHEGMLTFGAPWHPVVSITQLGRHDVEGRETRSITLGTHTGTQTDAPLHFVRGGKSIEQVPLEKCVGPVTIFDFSHLKENEVVTKAMLLKLKFEKKVIFRFGWGKHWNTKKFYQNYPFFSEDAARYLVSKKIDLLGFDTCSPDDGRTKLAGDLLGSVEDSPIHKIFLEAGVVLLEYVANLDTLKDLKGWIIAALPLKIRGGDGAPARVIIFK
jgi:kynurenine formamidase